MSVKQIFFFGRNGLIRHQVTGPLGSPLVEIETNYPAFQNDPVNTTHELSLDEIRSYFSPAYNDWGRFGHLGDLIAIKVMKVDKTYVYLLDYIGRLAIIKPGLAVDLMIFIEVSSFDYYFVGVKRKYDPGKGMPALMGGFIDVNGYHLDTPIETIIHEAKDEVGLKIKAVNQNDLINPLPMRVIVNIDYQNEDFRGELLYRGIIPTGDNERLASIGLKRVYQTTVYSLVLDMRGLELNEKKIREWLKAGDDAEELVIVNFKTRPQLKFGLKHHQLIFDSFITDMIADDKLSSFDSAPV